MDSLKLTYKLAAQAAYAAGESADNQEKLTSWIRANCKYRPDTEIYLVLGVGSALADIEAQAQEYLGQIDRIFKQPRMVALVTAHNAKRRI